MSHAMRDVEFAGRRVDAKIIASKPNFIHERVPAHVHTFLVERHEADTVNHPVLRRRNASMLDDSVLAEDAVPEGFLFFGL